MSDFIFCVMLRKCHSVAPQLQSYRIMEFVCFYLSQFFLQMKEAVNIRGISHLFQKNKTKIVKRLT